MDTQKKTLHLTLKKHWFDMIDTLKKTEEYRAIKPYWIKRLTTHFQDLGDGRYHVVWKDFEDVLFASGGHFGDVPKSKFELDCMEIREGRPEWGAVPGVTYFAIKLGERIGNG